MIEIILLIIAIIFTLITFVKGKQKGSLFEILSYICYFIAMLLSFYDILGRIENNDIVGILDIYPTMIIIYIATFIIITILHIYITMKDEG